MKILFFIESLRGSGKERRLAELLKGITQQTDFECELVLTCKNVHYSYVLDLGIKIHFLERKFLKKDPSIFIKFFNICKKFKPDIIHVWGNMVAIYAIPTKIILGIPMINNQITNAPQNVPKGLLSHKLTFAFSDMIIANSYAGLKAYQATKGKSIVIYNGFDFNRMNNLSNISSVSAKIKIKTKYIVTMLATFSDAKDYDTYIRAAELILDSRRDVTFLCIGKGNDAKYKLKIAQKNKDMILFPGRQSNVENIINVSDIGILTTNLDNHGEGISNAIMEFMAFSKPVIATDGGGTRELVIDDETGYLVPQKSPNILAQKLTKIIDDENLRISMGKKGNERITQSFNLDKMVNAYIDNYTNLLNRN